MNPVSSRITESPHVPREPSAGQGRQPARDLRSRVDSRLGLETKGPFILVAVRGGAKLEKATEVKPQTGFITKAHVSMWQGDDECPTLWNIYTRVCV